MGGGQITPLPLLAGFGRDLPFEVLRVWLVPFLPAVRIATRAASLFSVNGETTTMLRRAGAGQVPLLLDVGIPRRIVTQLARAIENLNGNRDKLAAMSRAGRRYAETEAWDSRAATMRERYASIRNAHAKLGDRSPVSPTVSLS